MSYSLVGYGRSLKNDALGGMSESARNSEQRDNTNRGLKDAKRTQEVTSMASGAVSGAMIGAKVGSAAPGLGTVIGAGIGLLAGWALS